MKTPNAEPAREFLAGRRAPCPRLCIRRRARWQLSHQEEGQGGPSPPGCAFQATSLGQPWVCLQQGGGQGRCRGPGDPGPGASIPYAVKGKRAR